MVVNLSLETPYLNKGGLHLQLPASTPSILKSSTSHEMHYDTARMGLHTAMPRTYSVEKNLASMVVEAPCEITYTSEPVKNEKAADPVSEDIEMDLGDETQEHKSSDSNINIVDLPEELQQRILDYVVGELSPVSSSNTGNGVRNWHYALRHSRAKDHTNLALITRLWCTLIQQRLYRHIRVQGTIRGLRDCHTWFLLHPHLQEHVRHVEFWVPVWEKRPSAQIQIPPLHTPDDIRQADSMQPISSNYQSCSTTSTIGEMFMLIQRIFSKVCVLTIEGGSCKKPPKIQKRRHKHSSIPVLRNIKILVLKGAWTMIREEHDYQQISAALPNLKDWQIMYTSPKYRAYKVMHLITPQLSSNITHLHLCMDGFYSKKWLGADKIEDLRQKHHLCGPLSILLQQLEALTFSGRACYHLFNSTMEAYNRNSTSKPRLKSVDLALRNCCRDSRNHIGEGMWIYNSNFISAFERLVVAVSSSLKWFVDLESIRIRFVDLDSPMASMNPYFQIKDRVAYGLYNDTILENLMVLPNPIVFAQNEPVQSDGQMYFTPSRRLPGRRPNRIHISEYAHFSHGA